MDLRGWVMPPPELGHLNKIYERPSGASGMRKKLLPNGALPKTPLGELAALPHT